jgi:hypothetical protein
MDSYTVAKKCDVQITNTTYRDLNELATKMRACDVEEIKASSGMTPADSLVTAIGASKYMMSMFFEHELGLVFGICPLSSKLASPWALGTDVVKRYPHQFVTATRAVLEGMIEDYEVLANVVDARNVDTLRWASVVGFTVQEPIIHGVARIPFHPIVMKRGRHV